MGDCNDIVYEYCMSDVSFSDGHDMITVRVASSMNPPQPRDFTYRDFKAVDENVLCNYV